MLCLKWLAMHEFVSAVHYVCLKWLAMPVCMCLQSTMLCLKWLAMPVYVSAVHYAVSETDGFACVCVRSVQCCAATPA